MKWKCLSNCITINKPAFTTYLIVDLEIVDGEYNVVEDRPLASEAL